MKRARLLATLAVLLASVAVEAQQPRNLPRVGVLSGVSPAFASPYIEVGRQALRDLGYVEGQNIAIEYRFADGRGDRLGELAVELVRLKPDVIVVVGDRAVDAVKHATSTIPIIMVSAGDPVRSDSSRASRGPGATSRGCPRSCRS